MTKSKFAESLQGLTSEQFDRVTADMLAEAARRGNTSSDWQRTGQMSDNEFEAFRNRAITDAENGNKARALSAAAASVGKVLADPKAAEENKEAGNDDGSTA